MNSITTLLVTGGAGFIGGNFVLSLMQRPGIRIINLDSLTYAGNLDTLEPVKDNPDHLFVLGSIGDRDLVDYLLDRYQPQAILNFAAESHVDRSINAPDTFIPDECGGYFSVAGIGPAILEKVAGNSTIGLPVSACINRRGIRQSGG